MRISEFAEIADMSQFHYTMESIDVFQTQQKQYGLVYSLCVVVVQKINMAY